jgi:hypothetical protein
MPGQFNLFDRGMLMEYATKERWRCLCEQIAIEQDAKKFSELFDEVCLLLEQREAELMGKRQHRLARNSQTGMAS